MNDRADTTENDRKLARQAPPSGVRRGGLWLLFAVVMAVPKTLALRRNSRTWNLLRLAGASVGIAGAIFAWVHHAGIAVAAGALLFVAALAIPPERIKLSVDRRARELGALVVVDGGRYRPVDGAARDARLFVAPDRILVLDARLRGLLDIPLARVTHMGAEPAAGAWKLRIEWDGACAEFLYRGVFAEHLAQVAESTIRSQLRRELPVLP